MCPDCREPLVGYELEGVEIDRCPRCGGIWLDTGELEAILRLTGTPEERIAGMLRPVEAGTRRGGRRCPRCRRRLRAATLGRVPVEIDRCRGGHGMWLDSGELPAILRAYSEGEAGPAARFLAELLRADLEARSQGE